ncbi:MULTISPECIES: class I SAM-dependent methyltransferase [Virgibacillus]|uniref:class I SAM-dependent methyltransferase n=1 Tax=Virgibacillus TaxID=84406 RepID=UPI00098BCE12|nr:MULTISPECIES: class I SAM-dependent methyltransferase [Virgibacillus]NWO13052.1 class I SAM-dependent methyltransferase [Virgibacillus sp.]
MKNSKSNVETLYSWIDEITTTIQEYVNETYLDSLIYAQECIFHCTPTINHDEQLTHKLETLLQTTSIADYTVEEIRKANQLAILKGMKGSIQAQHMMTPETIALIIAYLSNKLMEGQKSIRIFDPASGTGNLLTTVYSQLPQDKEAYASEVDPTLIQLGVWNANLQKQQIEFFHQDSLQPFLLDPVDLVVADLPVGYYPDDMQASRFELQAKEGHSYAHHLFMEQSLKYTVDGAYLLFVIPEFLFESDQADQLKKFLHEHAHIVGLLGLPDTAFQTDKQKKSILILQKKGHHTTTPKQPLLVKMPSFSNTNAMGDILGQINNWFQTYKKRS